MNAAGASSAATRRRTRRARRRTRRTPARSRAPQLRDAALEFVARRTGWPATTTATRSPGFRARGLTHHSEAAAISSAIAPVRVAAQHVCRSARRPVRDAGPAARRGEEALLGAPLPRQRVLERVSGMRAVLDGVHQRLERRRLRVDVAAADRARRRSRPRSACTAASGTGVGRWRSPSSRGRRSGSRRRTQLLAQHAAARCAATAWPAAPRRATAPARARS